MIFLPCYPHLLHFLTTICAGNKIALPTLYQGRRQGRVQEVQLNPPFILMIFMAMVHINQHMQLASYSASMHIGQWSFVSSGHWSPIQKILHISTNVTTTVVLQVLCMHSISQQIYVSQLLNRNVSRSILAAKTSSIIVGELNLPDRIGEWGQKWRQDIVGQKMLEGTGVGECRRILMQR